LDWANDFTCNGIPATTCVEYGTVGLFQTFLGKSFETNSGINRRRTYSSTMVPIQSANLSFSDLANRPNATDFLDIYTLHHSDGSRSRVSHRKLTENDQNNNTVNLQNLRATTTGPSTSSNHKRLQQTVEDVVVDWLYEDGVENVFDEIEALPLALEDIIAISTEFIDGLSNENCIATCANMIYESNPDYTNGQYENVGLFAFGWNDKPFGFNGRAGEWIKYCQSLEDK
jgi:hypothetical protein